MHDSIPLLRIMPTDLWVSTIFKDVPNLLYSFKQPLTPNQQVQVHLIEAVIWKEIHHIYLILFK